MTKTHTKTIKSAISRAIRPRANLLVSDWADKNRRLSSKSSSEQGRWSTSRTPFAKEPMDCLSLSSSVRRVVLMFPSQMGKSEVLHNWIAYVMHHAPSPMMVFRSTTEKRDGWVRKRLNPMIESTPVLSEIMNVGRRRDGGNSVAFKDFPGGSLTLAGANSPNSYAEESVKYVAMDEVDRFPAEVGEEGDPISLAENRQKAFPRRKLLLLSTPTIKDESIIEREYLDSDQRCYHVPCPHCGGYQILVWKRLQKQASGKMVYRCEECDRPIEEHHKPDMIKQGQWVPEHPGRLARGYHINALYAPLGLGYNWAELWDKWEKAQKNKKLLKTFINTQLAEVWEEKSVTVEAMPLLMRREDYSAMEIRPLAITGGIDVQKDRLELTLAGWEHGEECYPLDHIIVPGDTALEPVWDDLGDILDDLSPDGVIIDAGYRPDMVKKFCATRSWCTPGKGIPGTSRPLIEDEIRRKQRLRKRRKPGTVPVEPLGVDSGKAVIYARLELKDAGKGYIHFPISPAFDEEYFQQLTAEKYLEDEKKWVKIRARNETLDCIVYALAACRLYVDLDRLMEKREAERVQVTQKAPPAPRVIPAQIG